MTLTPMCNTGRSVHLVITKAICISNELLLIFPTVLRWPSLLGMGRWRVLLNFQSLLVKLSKNLCFQFILYLPKDQFRVFVIVGGLLMTGRIIRAANTDTYSVTFVKIAQK